MRKPVLLSIALLLAVVLALGACAQNSGKAGGNGESYAPPDVTMNQTDFDHNTLTIPAGTTVKFINPASASMHILCVGTSATCDGSASGPSALTGGSSLQTAPGETKEVTFDKPGTYKIACTLHPMMNLTITVQ
ncbi:MAG TPA: plastocyanin/azurin family copper-binding protein [Ktedonobacterales bacterium]